MASDYSIPQEIIEIVVDHIRHHRSALLACHQTSRAFLPRTRKYIFDTAVLSPASAAFFLENSHLIPLIRRLDVSGLEYTDRDGHLESELHLMGDFLQHLPTLDTLRFKEMWGAWGEKMTMKKVLDIPLNTTSPEAKASKSTWRKLQDKLVPGRKHSNQLDRSQSAILLLRYLCVVDARRVELLRVYFNTSEDYRVFLLSFPSLSSLRLHFDLPSSKGITNLPSAAVVVEPRVKVQQLEMVSDLYPEESSLLDVSELSSLSLQPSLSGFGDFLFIPAQIISSSRTTLRHLSINIGGTGWAPEKFRENNALDFTSFPNLTSVGLKFIPEEVPQGEQIDGMVVLLEMLRPIHTQLQTLNLIALLFCYLSEPEDIYIYDEMRDSAQKSLNLGCRDWTILSQKLQDYELLTSLKTLIFTAEFMVDEGLNAKARETVPDLVLPSIPQELRKLPRAQFQWDVVSDLF